MMLGAILAGGQARRFGGDKAAAEVGGMALIERVVRALRPQCARLVVVGRDWPGLERVEDRPTAGLGPLGALAGALSCARERGYDDVLTSGCDLPDLPPDLADLLAPGPAVVAGQPLLGLWQVEALDALLAHLAAGGSALKGWVTESGAREIDVGRLIANINTREDLADYEHRSFR